MMSAPSDKRYCMHLMAFERRPIPLRPSALQPISFTCDMNKPQLFHRLCWRLFGHEMPLLHLAGVCVRVGGGGGG